MAPTTSARLSPSNLVTAQSDVSALAHRLAAPVTNELLELALTHRSFAYESGGIPTNERLEFLGDSVLSIVITDALYHAHPDVSEGQLAKLRSAVVNARALADVARTLDIGSHIRLGKGEEVTGGRDKSSILADTMEAVIGAIYLSSGIDAARTFVLDNFTWLMQEAADLGAALDWKTSLQELTAVMGKGVPNYVVEQSGLEHQKYFTAQVQLSDGLYGHGEGSNKKQAEQQAAASAYAELEAIRQVQE